MIKLLSLQKRHREYYVETRYKIIHLMFMRLVLVYLHTILVTLFSVHDIKREYIKDIEDETTMLKVDIINLASDYESP